MTGSIPDSLLSLPYLRVLNLSGNNLSGNSLCKQHNASLVFRYESDGRHMCDKTKNPSKTRSAVLAISVVVPVLLIVVLPVAYFIRLKKRKLKGKQDVAQALNWGTRLRVLLEAAQGLDYLHKGCNMPIVHRDLKSSNILLGHNLQAKIADFGLIKTYLSDTQTHISATNLAGTAGYIDPEYQNTGRLTESCDVYSFGVVVLEVATGEAPTVPGHGHIVQRVKQKIATGDISLIADVRLGGSYDINSMWKVVEIAMMCTEHSAAQRPTMATVMVMLKESLALEEAREKDTMSRRAQALIVQL